MNLSVIICTYNRAKYIPGLLQSLVEQTCNKSNYEIVFVNNNSKDNTEEICKEFQQKNTNLNFNYFLEINQGLSHARNRGIKEANGEMLIFIDDDAIACNSYIKEVLSFFDQNKNVAAAGGKILPKFESQSPKWMSKFLIPILSVIDLGNNIKKFPTGKFPIGANMFFRKNVFEKTGLFDTELGRTGKNMLGSEEKDIFNKLKNIGGIIYYLPNPWIYHIIPDERLTMEFVEKQALGIGHSEKIRVKNISKMEIFKSYIKEVLKWGASFILFALYFMSFQLPKGIMILKFRFWVSKGMFKKQI